jgi:hypothetical protein
MNVFVDGKYLCSFDNSKWSEENGNTPFSEVGYDEHLYAYWRHEEETKNAKEWLYGSSEVYSRRSDEGTLA